MPQQDNEHKAKMTIEWIEKKSVNVGMDKSKYRLEIFF